MTMVAVIRAVPSNLDEALEIPAAIETAPGLDEGPSWIVVTEVNRFIWPGPDLVPISRNSPMRFDYGVLPPGFFRTPRNSFVALARASRVRLVARLQ